MLREARMYARFLAGLRGYLKDPITLDQAREHVRLRLERRAESLLLMAEKGVFGLKDSPYRELLRLAGCEIGDFRDLVHDRGVEGALRELREAGVYFTFEEFKGRHPVVRDGREIQVSPEQFDNPHLSHYLRVRSGGSTGRATRVSTDLDHLAVQAEHRMICLDAQGAFGLPYGIWRPPLPSGSGINSLLRGARWGDPPTRWFTPLGHSDFRPGIKFRVANDLTVVLGRLFGSDLPWPEPVSLDRALVIAEWMSEMRDTRGGVVLNTTVSNGVRIALAASEAGIRLDRTWLYLAGEPLTPAKAARLLESGATIMTDYGASECGRVGIGCPHHRNDGDVHVLSDMIAVVGVPRYVAASGETVTSLHLTSLQPSSPKLLFNVEFDDCAVVETRSCGCSIEALGLTQHLRHIRSFGKLVGEGVSLLASEMEYVIEAALPSRFGGSPLDYQIEETEGSDGLTRLALVVSPHVSLPAEELVIEGLLEALGEVSAAADVARAFWRQSQTVQLLRAKPHVTSPGKQPLLYKRSLGAGSPG